MNVIYYFPGFWRLMLIGNPIAFYNPIYLASTINGVKYY